MADYKLVLQAEINPQGIEKQINTLSKNYQFQLRVKLDFSEIENQIKKFKSQLGEIGEKLKTNDSSKGAVLFDEGQNQQILDRLQKKMDQIKASATKVVKEGITTVDIGNGETLTKSTMQYIDGVGKARTATLQWKTTQEGVAEAVKLTTNYIDASGKMYEKMNSLADKFLDKSKKLGNSKEVSQGINLSNRIKELTGKGNLNVDETKELDKAYKRLQVLDSTVKASGKNLQNWSTELGVAIKRTLEWFSAMTLVHGSLRQLGLGVQYIKDLNKEMTSIQVLQVAGAQTNDEITKLAGNFNNLAKELSISTLEVAKGSVEWLRQGKTIQETGELIKATAMLSKLGNLSAADSTEYLTSSLNAYKLSAKDAISIVDKLVSVDNVAATSSGELASALQRTASFAAMSGVSIDKLIGYIK